jgi:hypothetical protein
MRRPPVTAWIRRARTRTLVAIGAALTAAFVLGNVLVSLGSGASVKPPPPTSLSELLLRESGAAGAAGISAHFHYANRLVPDASALPAITGSGPAPLLEGADGRLWWAGGRLRIEFQTDAGDTQLLVHGNRALMYDASAGNAFSAELPALGGAGAVRSGLAGAAQLLLGMRTRVHVSRPQPGVTAGRPSYTVTLRPAGGGSLIGAVRVAVDAATGTPLAITVAGRRDRRPVIQVTLSDVSYAPVSPDVFRLQLPFGMHPSPIRFSPPSLGGDASCAGPPRVASLRLSSCRLESGGPGTAGRVLVYGAGLGAVAVLEEPSQGGDPAGGLWALLPTVQVRGAEARELVTTLGTVVRFERGGVIYTVAGSRPASLVRAVAGAL